MKAKRFFYGTDSYGRSVERAQSESGKWFSRSYEFNGFGKSWGKWQEETEEPAFETHGENAYSGESFEYEKPVCFWGFNKMSELDDIPRVRLPE